MRHVVQDLITEALPHDFGRHFPRAKTGHPCSPAVIARHLIYLRVDDGARNFDDEVFLRIADVNEFCFHFLIGGVPQPPLKLRRAAVALAMRLHPAWLTSLRSHVVVRLRSPRPERAYTERVEGRCSL